VQAEQRWFEVELLLFQRNVDIQGITEDLSSDELIVDSSNSVNMLNSSPDEQCVAGQACLSTRNPTVIGSAEFDTGSNHFLRLDSSQLQLTAQREKLERHARFEPLLHMAWRMPTVSGRIAKPLHIFAGKNLAPREPAIAQQVVEQSVTTTLLSEDPSYEVFDAPTSVNQIVDNTQQEINKEDKWEIDGNFKVYLDHYLFIDTQLIIRQAVTETVQRVEQTAVELIDDENGVQIAKQIENSDIVNTLPEIEQRIVIKEALFDQNRRLRSGEIHYLDHPLMGIIVQIRKIPESELAQIPEQLSEQLISANELIVENGLE